MALRLNLILPIKDRKSGLLFCKYIAKIINKCYSEDEIFKYFNKPGIDFAAETGRGFRFSHDPILNTKCALFDEWTYLQEKYGYIRLDRKGDFWYAVKE